MRAPPLIQPVSRVRTVKPTVPIQPMVASGLPLSGVIPTEPTLATIGPSTSTNPGGSRIGGLKLEILEKYTGSRIPTI